MSMLSFFRKKPLHDAAHAQKIDTLCKLSLYCQNTCGVKPSLEQMEVFVKVVTETTDHTYATLHQSLCAGVLPEDVSILLKGYIDTSGWKHTGAYT